MLTCEHPGTGGPRACLERAPGVRSGMDVTAVGDEQDRLAGVHDAAQREEIVLLPGFCRMTADLPNSVRIELEPGLPSIESVVGRGGRA
jgi:hypothetical protein